jgi:hypothetical protein
MEGGYPVIIVPYGLLTSSQAVFLVFGAITVAWSIFIYFFLPDTPANARFLDREDRVKAIDRVRENMTGIRSDTWKWSQSIEALTDTKIWLLVAVQLSQQIANGGVHGVGLRYPPQDAWIDISQFGSIVIKGFGFSTLNTLLVQMISVAFQAVFVIFGTVGSTYLKNVRTYFMAFNLAISLTGSIMVRELDASNIWPRFIGYCFCIAYSANFPLVLSISSSNVGGFTKKNTANAMVSPDAGSADLLGTSTTSVANETQQVFIAYCLGNIIGPQLFFEDEAPSYPSGFLSMIVCFGAALVLSIVLRMYLIWENRGRDNKTGTVIDLAEDQIVVVDLGDATDKEIANFRYVY